MRTVTNSAFTINYPDNLVFSGDLNRIRVTKNTTATHVEMSFTLGGYSYAENLYFFGSYIDFSISDILELLFTRSLGSTFDTTKNLNFTLTLYNNTSLIDSESLSIDTVILGKRRVFDELGVIKNITTIDINENLGVLSFNYFFTTNTYLYIKYYDGSIDFLDTYEGVSLVNLTDFSEFINEIEYLFYSSTPFSYVFDETFAPLEKIYLNKADECQTTDNIKTIRFLNRFGMFRYYFMSKRTEIINGQNGINLFFVENNYTELNNLYSEQNKTYTQNITLFKNCFTKELLNDFSDIAYSDHVNLYDNVNEVWVPVKIQTNSFVIDEKESLFDVSINLTLQSNNE